MIPKNINQKHILKAIKEIDINGVPKGRASRKFLLKYKTKTYPPKYTVGLANKFANGKELNPDRYSGGVGETNAFLKRLGFTVTGVDSFGKTKQRRKPKTLVATKTRKRHPWQSESALRSPFKNKKIGAYQKAHLIR